jgi:hypothetical protein
VHVRSRRPRVPRCDRCRLPHASAG